jgi:hypothetical protein
MPPPEAQTLYRTLTAEPARPDNPQHRAGHPFTSVVATGLLINTTTANGIDGKGAGETTVFTERLCKYIQINGGVS